MPALSYKYMQIEPVGQCNLRCEMCPIQFRRDGPPYGPPAYMKFDVFRKLMNDSPELEELHLQGLGEPMMHPQFFEMVSYAAGKGLRVSTNTNLTLLDPKRADRCITSGLNYLHISIDGATAPTYEKIRVRARFNDLLRRLRAVMDARQKLSSALPHVRLVTVIMRQNLAELPDIVRIARDHGITEMFVQHLAHDFQESSLPAHYKPMRDFVQEQTLLNEDEARRHHFFNEAMAVARESGIDLRLPNVLPIHHKPGTPGQDRCDWPWKGPYISYQGYAMPCCMVATPDRIHFGDMAAEGPQAVWNGTEYSEFRRQLASDEPPEVCRSCSIYRGIF